MKKVFTLSIILVLFVFGACSEKGIEMFSGDLVYISFTKNASADSMIYSFKTYPSGEIVVKVPEFIKAIDEAAEAGTFVDVRVVAPYTNITKGQIAGSCRIFIICRLFITVDVCFFWCLDYPMLPAQS